LKLFPGQYFDSETGLHYNYKRYYDPGTGRYITADPIGLAGLDTNLYRYVLNNPVKYIDPLGLWAFTIEGYYGFGGGITFGKNPNGSAFITIRGGYGFGGGFLFDPNGTSPGYDPCRPGTFKLEDYTTAGGFGGLNAAFGPAFAGINGNVGNRYENGRVDPFFGTDVSYGVDFDSKLGLRLGGAVGVEFSFVDAPSIQLAGQ
jgi:RHS repeat-associated protein